MPKNVIIIAIVVLILLGGSAAYFLSQNNTPNEGNVVTSIKDTLSKSASMECNYTEENRVTKAYIKNGAVRIEFAGRTKEQSGNIIVVDKKIYAWSPDGKGYTIDVPDVTPAPGEQKMSQNDEIMQSLEKYKEYCKNATVSDSLFVPPADIKFEDYSQMMNQIAPTIGAGSGMTEEQVKEAMEKYQTEQ